MRSDGLWIAALAALACACGHAAPAPPPRAPAASPTQAARSANATLPLIFLGQIRIDSSLGAALPARIAGPGPLTITLRAVKPMSDWGELAKRVRPSAVTADAFTFEYDRYPSSTDAVTPADRQASFVVDFDEPSVRALHDRVAPAERSSGMEALAKFVGDFIDVKDMDRGFDVASVVARRHEGDCSEHAVLLAALARSFGFPARVVLGLAVVAIDGQALAMGHAWVEYLRDGAWRLADAALPPEVHARYLPLVLLTNEGPGFERAWFDTLDVLSFRAIALR